MNRANPPIRTATPASAGFGLYVHWPFCLSKCPYCDFNSHVRATIEQARWRAALVQELGHFAGETTGRTLTSIFFGGGTPSLMAADTVAAVIERAAASWSFAADIEITLEANPTSVESGRLADYKSAGVNRVSLGVQSLDDADLRFLGRGHSAGEAAAAIAAARQLFDRVSFDLIYARPHQTVSSWQAELAHALTLAADHLSVYQLTIEPDTVFAGAYRRGELAMPDDDAAIALFEETQAILESAGLLAYEISNHARPGAECRHNLTYWRYGDYVGIGPGAHGRLDLGAGIVATRAKRAPEAWLEGVEAAGTGGEAEENVSASDAASEMLMMGLRLGEGVDLVAFRRRTGMILDQAVDSAALARLIEGGFLTRDGRRLTATRSGRPVLNAVLAALL